jgi:ABC-type multidrug transport system fused ATPase/permease subunit
MWYQIRQILALLNDGERRRLKWLLATMVLMGLIDVIGISSVFPFMAVVAKPEIVQANHTLNAIYEYLGFGSVYRFLFFMGIVVLLAIFIANLFGAFVTWLLLRFSHTLGHELSIRILRGFVGKPYVFFLSRNSTTLGLVAVGEVGGLVTGVLVPGLQAVSKAIVACFILLLLVAVDFLLAITVAVVVGGAYLCIFLGVRRRIARLGDASVESNRLRYKVANEALAGIKDLKILGLEQNLLDRFAGASGAYARAQVHSGLIAALPRYALETLAFGGILLILLYLLAIKKDIAQALPLIALYSIAGYRLMPAIQQVFHGLALVRFGLANLEGFHRELADVRPAHRTAPPARRDAVAPLPFEREIQLDGVAVSYPGAGGPALMEVSIPIRKNTTVGFVGATGSGKTTLVDTLIGLLQPERGRVLVDNVPLCADNIRRWQNRIGYVQQAIYLIDDTIERNIAFGTPDDRIDRAQVVRAAQLANIHDFIETELRDGYQSLVGERGVRLSGGQRQRIGIARALYHEPDVLVLDEATSALDSVTEDVIIDAIRSLAHRKTIILIAHRLTTVQDCDVIFLLEDGHIVDQGSYADLLARNPSFRAMAKGRVAA